MGGVVKIPKEFEEMIKDWDGESCIHYYPDDEKQHYMEKHLRKWYRKRLIDPHGAIRKRLLWLHNNRGYKTPWE